jgi:hypothetical protein
MATKRDATCATSSAIDGGEFGRKPGVTVARQHAGTDGGNWRWRGPIVVQHSNLQHSFLLSYSPTHPCPYSVCNGLAPWQMLASLTDAWATLGMLQTSVRRALVVLNHLELLLPDTSSLLLSADGQDTNMRVAAESSPHRRTLAWDRRLRAVRRRQLRVCMSATQPVWLWAVHGLDACAAGGPSVCRMT